MDLNFEYIQHLHTLLTDSVSLFLHYFCSIRCSVFSFRLGRWLWICISLGTTQYMCVCECVCVFELFFLWGESTPASTVWHWYLNSMVFCFHFDSIFDILLLKRFFFLPEEREIMLFYFIFILPPYQTQSKNLDIHSVCMRCTSDCVLFYYIVSRSLAII